MLGEKLHMVFLVAAFISAAALISCSDGSSSSGGVGGGGAAPPQIGEQAFVTTTNFTDSGSYSTINLRDQSGDADLPSQAGIIESDNDAVYYNNMVYVINRLGFDNITVLDVSDLSTAIKQFSTGNGSNPQDMAFVSDSHAYVSLYEENDILRVDPTAAAGSEIVGRIDLSGLAALYNDPDGIVEAQSMMVVGRYLFVALQLLDRNNFFSPTATSVLAVIDTTTDQLVDVDPATPDVDAIVLTGQNPQFMRYISEVDKIAVSETGSFGVNDGGIETVDPLTFAAEGIFVDENDLDGDLGDFVTVDGLKGYAVISFLDASFNFFNKVVIFDEDGNNLGDLTGDLPFIPSLAIDSDKRILVPDRTLTAPGIRIFDSITDAEVTASPIDVGLPPNTVIVLYN
jgi:hypothetical protein